jgi:hypothetical protein
VWRRLTRDLEPNRKIKERFRQWDERTGDGLFAPASTLGALSKLAVFVVNGFNDPSSRGLSMDTHAKTNDQERWRQLCKLAEQETNPDRLLDLANKILEVLDQKYQSLTKKKLQ